MSSSRYKFCEAEELWESVGDLKTHRNTFLHWAFFLIQRTFIVSFVCVSFLFFDMRLSYLKHTSVYHIFVLKLHEYAYIYWESERNVLRAQLLLGQSFQFFAVLNSFIFAIFIFTAKHKQKSPMECLFSHFVNDEMQSKRERDEKNTNCSVLFYFILDDRQKYLSSW